MKKNTIFGQVVAFLGRLILRYAAAASLGSRKETREMQTIATIDEWIQNKGWTEDKSMEETAEELAMSREQLSRYFLLRFGLSFIRWRREIRVEEAKRILRDNKTIPTALVGEAVGISDKSNFRRQFKEITGYTPAEWRRLEN